MLIELLSFLIMVPLAIILWRGIAAFFASRNPGSQVAQTIQVAVGGGS